MIESILGAISVLLVFVILFIDITTRKAFDFIDMPKPHISKVAEMKSYRRFHISTNLFAVASTIVVCMTSYLFLPTALYVIKVSSFNLWDFDVISTAFLLIEFLLILLSGYMGWLLFRINQQ